MTVLAAHRWPTNGHLIEDVARLGYLRREWRTLDPTYGAGVFWRRWRPEDLTTCDLVPSRGCTIPHGVDFRSLPWGDDAFDAVAFDPPYKLNGKPSEPDRRYGVDVERTWQQRHQLIREGMTECNRVLRPRGRFLLKCQDQVCWHRIRWQTDEFTRHAELLGMVKVDAFQMLGGRAQPGGRSQVHAHHRPSTLLVFQADR